jgi:hypothetical protein
MPEMDAFAHTHTYIHAYTHVSYHTHMYTHTCLEEEAAGGADDAGEDAREQHLHLGDEKAGVWCVVERV